MLLIASILIFGCSPKYITTTKTVTVTDTVTNIVTLPQIEVNCPGFVLDTAIDIEDDLLLINIKDNKIKFELVLNETKNITTVEEEKIPMSAFKARIRQEQQTMRTMIRQTEKTARDSINEITRQYKDSLKFVTKAYIDSLKFAKRIHVSDNRVEKAKTKGSWFARFKNGIFWLLIGIIIGFLLRTFLKIGSKVTTGI